MLHAVSNTRWYLMGEMYKKELRFIIHRAQNPVQLVIVGFGHVGAVTFVQVLEKSN
jgi:hypothetical protein